MVAVMQPPRSATEFLQTTDTKAIYTHTVKVPRELKPYRAGIGYAIFNLALGKAAPVCTSSIDLISVDFILNARAEAYLYELLGLSEFRGNKRKVFCSALTWLREQPRYHDNIKIY